jgi:hypothetical protein
MMNLILAILIIIILVVGFILGSISKLWIGILTVLLILAILL